MSLPRVLVLHNEPTLPPDHPDADSEHDILDTADCMAKIVQEAGLPVARFGFTDDLHALLRGLDANKPDVVFNLYEGTAKWGNTEAYVTGLLEMLRIPFTGSPTQPLILAKSKALTKQLLEGAGLPTARFRTIIGDEPIPVNDLGWPVIVKPGREDASVGIDQKSVVTSQEALTARIDYIRRSYGPEVIFEQFIIGREFHVAVWERDGVAETLPFSEIFFHETQGDDPLWPIVSFDAKWKENSRDYKATPVKNPAAVEPALERRIAEIAIQAFHLLGCRDYARIDFRVRGEEIFILEVNPNPCISPLAGVAEALATKKVPFAEFTLSLLKSALKRGTRTDLASFANTPLIVHASEAKPIHGIKTQEVDCGSTCSFIAKSGEETIGELAIRTLDAAEAIRQIALFSVQPEYRRRGIASQLLREAESHLARHSVRKLLMETTSGVAAAALRQFLYARGFRAAGECPDYYRDGSSRLTFTKPLIAVPPPPIPPSDA